MPIQTIIVRLATPISSGAVHAIDLGMVSLRDAAIYGRTRPLIPYAEGRLIKSVHYVPGGTHLTALEIGITHFFFSTPNTGDNYGNAYGYGTFGAGSPASADTDGLLSSFAAGNTGINGLTTSNQDFSQILDAGPLVLGAFYQPGTQNGYDPMLSWQAGRIYCVGDTILDPNDHMQMVSVNGVAGSVEPTWDDSGGTTPDGTATLTDWGVIPNAQVHVVVEVVEGISPMPPFPASVEFVAPPVNVVVGETMPDVTLIVKDQFGQPYTFTETFVVLSIFGDGAFHGTFGTETIDLTTGIATFSGLVFDVPGTYILRSNIYPSIASDPIFSDPFDVT